MNINARTSMGWLLTGLIGLMLLASAGDKIAGSAHAQHMGSSFGLSSAAYRILGLIELMSVLLFVFPQTGVVGTLLLAAYLGGAIATHLQHQQDILFPLSIEALVWLTALIRFPELSKRLTNHSAGINLDAK